MERKQRSDPRAGQLSASAVETSCGGATRALVARGSVPPLSAGSQPVPPLNRASRRRGRPPVGTNAATPSASKTSDRSRSRPGHHPSAQVAPVAKPVWRTMSCVGGSLTARFNYPRRLFVVPTVAASIDLVVQIGMEHDGVPAPCCASQLSCHGPVRKATRGCGMIEHPDRWQW